MSELNDRLRRDGARWREQVDAQHASDPDPVFDRVLSGPASASPVHALRGRFTGRTSLLLSIAAVTVSVLAIGGAVLASDLHDAHPTTSLALGVTAVPTASSLPPSSATPSVTAPHRRISTTGNRPGPGGPAPSGGKRHSTKQNHPTRPARSTTAPPACDSSSLGIRVSSPVSVSPPASASASESSAPTQPTTLTVFVTNNGIAPCTMPSFPAVQLTGDSSVTAAATDDPGSRLILPSGATATAELDWEGASEPGSCTSYATTVVTTPDGGTVQLALDEPAQVCDASTFVMHPLTAS